ncbi:MAG TPA: hypothetical protein VGH83_10590, partial [Candidatus Acidoferrum sp.]
SQPLVFRPGPCYYIFAFVALGVDIDALASGCRATSDSLFLCSPERPWTQMKIWRLKAAE